MTFARQSSSFSAASSFLCFSALWAAIIVGGVIARIVEREPEVIDRNPSLNKEQADEWNREFFTTSRLAGLSRIEQLNENPYHLVESAGYRTDRQHHSNNNNNNNNFPSRYPSFTDTSSSGGSGSRTNTRHYDVSSITLPYAGKKPVIKTENLVWMLQNIFNYPRSHVTNETAKEFVKKYISDSFQFTSLMPTTIQHFEPIQFLNVYESGQLPKGANVIGILKGREWGTPNDKPIVVGAHYDTVNFTPGTDDNGSGVSAMLETARAISHSGCKPKYTVFYVAFDLEESGSQGSLVFIKEYLMKILKSNFPKEIGMAKFQGAFIMDTILNFNSSEYSQTFPTDWSLVVPDVYDQVANERFKGDFLSMIYRRDVEFRLAEKFDFHWRRSSHEQKYKLKPFPLMLTADLPELEILADHLNFLRSDHARFWYMNDSSVPTTLNAILMTDSGPYRGNMRNCYHSVCDGPEISLNADNIKFLSKITQVLTDTVIDISECNLGGDSVWDHKKESSASNTFLSTSNVNVKNSSPRLLESPLKNVFNFIRWMQNAL